MNSEKAYIKRLEIHKKIIEDKLNYVLDNYMSINYKYRDLEKRIQKAIEDLEKIKKYNKNENGLINVDIDHIEYLLDILKGVNNE